MSNNVAGITLNNVCIEYSGYKKIVTHMNIFSTYAFDYNYYKI